ncbi:hypothetical protein N7509_000204 [Penicillium cosmopolitanum]|uniref:PNPLA domain-containing protein n=1 Tax=Penicillium cosmopolitanum TaxID=1131564 RepID=A0A9W9WCC9_9EURO|nr:uncharacterized protein N7509_000204 [Penicillium cosmopolitanum]KAJ5414870.1 hypothetical protein N7509_000204 [Penicillium cosmopolitanum]
MTTESPVRVLCLDGGGIRGISALYVLDQIMAQVNRQRRNSTPSADLLRPCDVFDLICGTSTGGLIALMLGRLEMDVEQAIKCYKKLSRSIFTSFSKRNGEKFDHIVLENKIKDIISSGPLGLDPEALAANPNPTSCKTFTVAIRTRGAAHVPAVMRTYGSPVFSPFRGKIWEMARATSAAPTFFLPITIDDITYGDGGAGGYNNPAELAIDEVEYIWQGKRRISCLISLGTGLEPALQLQNPETLKSENWLERTFGILAPNKAFEIEVARYLVNCLTNCETVHDRIDNQQTRYGVKHRYFRLNMLLPHIGLEEWEKISDIISLTEGFTENRKFFNLKRDIATMLLDRAVEVQPSVIAVQPRSDENGRNFLHKNAVYSNVGNCKDDGNRIKKQD